MILAISPSNYQSKGTNQGYAKKALASASMSAVLSAGAEGLYIANKLSKLKKMSSQTPLIPIKKEINFLKESTPKLVLKCAITGAVLSAGISLISRLISGIKNKNTENPDSTK